MKGYVRKRKGVWAAELFIGRDPVTRKQQRKYATFDTKGEAESWLASEISRLGSGPPITSSRLQLGTYLDGWLHDYAEGHVRETTLRVYRYAVERHIKPALSGVSLHRVTPMLIENWLTRLQQTGLSPSTVHQAFRVLREALRQAVVWRMLPASPMSAVKGPRVPHKEMRVWNEEQVRLFLGEAKRSSKHYALYLTAILTGMRFGELLALRWHDIDWTFSRVSVRQTLVRLKKRVVIQEPKSAKSRRVIALPPMALAALNDLPRVSDLVFCQPSGKPLHANNLTRRDFRRVTKSAGLPRIRFHDLRHSHATLLLRQGAHAKVVQERLGHSTPAFTLQTYSHVVPGLESESVNRLADLLGKDATASEFGSSSADEHAGSSKPLQDKRFRPDE